MGDTKVPKDIRMRSSLPFFTHPCDGAHGSSPILPPPLAASLPSDGDPMSKGLMMDLHDCTRPLGRTNSPTEHAVSISLLVFLQVEPTHA